ncbi:hypothetical protein ES703_87590 [subsurface metagenome]
MLDIAVDLDTDSAILYLCAKAFLSSLGCVVHSHCVIANEVGIQSF